MMTSDDPTDRARPDARGILDALAKGLVAREGETTRAEGIDERSLERLLDIARAMNRIHDRDELLRRVSGWLRELFDAENSFVVLYDEEGHPRVHCAHMRDPRPEELPISETILRRARASREPILIDDTAEIPELSDRRSVEFYKIRSVLCAPLVLGETVIGILQFDHRSNSHPFPERDRRLLGLFADQAATAFHNLQLIERLNAALDQVREAHARLVRAERLSALGEMATGMAHNFNNTLFVALGFCDVLLANPDLEEGFRSSIESIRNCSLDAANTVRRLQEFARGEAEGDPLTLSCPSRVLEELLPIVLQKCDQAEAKLDIHIDVTTDIRETPSVAARPSDLREVLTNLVFNAVDAMEASGTIELSSGTRGGWTFLRVADQGIGMDMEVRDRIFEPFFTTKGRKGSGLGLSTSWSIARRLGGELDVESTPGLGSTFTLWLPAVEAPEEGAPAEEPVAASGRRVLVIDDDPEVLDIVSRLLLTLGHEVVEFDEAADALRALDSQTFDVVITDLGMPGLSGTDVARAVHRRRPGLPVLILTGWGAEAEARARLCEGVTGVLSKPLSVEGLRNSLGRILAP